MEFREQLSGAERAVGYLALASAWSYLLTRYGHGGSIGEAMKKLADLKNNLILHGVGGDSLLNAIDRHEAVCDRWRDHFKNQPKDKEC
jgi:hypothetical protein